LPVHNSEIAELFHRLADLLEIEGANQFRVRAYRNAARTIGEHPRSMADMIEAGEDLTELHGIGKVLADKIGTIVHTGSLPQLEEVRRRTPAELAEILSINGLGPRRIQAIHQELGVTSLDELRQAAEAGKIRDLHGMGEKIEQRILEGLDRRQGE
jgi:DNA polymerase (family 10)